jgi:hypothetical protein
MNPLRRIAGKIKRRFFGVPGTPELANEPPVTYQLEGASARWYMHDLDAYTPRDADFSFREDVGSPDQATIINRLINYFRHMEEVANARAILQPNDMWLVISKGHEPLRAALRAGDVSTISQMLLKVATGPLVAGFMNVEPYERIRDKPHMRAIEEKHFIDKLLSLGEALGLIPVQGIEQGKRGYDVVEIDQILSAVQSRVGFDIAPPSAGGGSFGYKTADGVINLKDLYAICTTYQSRCLARDLPAARVVAEIGGGTGTLGYYLHRSGFDRVMIFDLPVVSVIQAYFLMRSVGSAKVWLHGEADSDAPIRIHPHWTLADVPEKSVGLFVNQDSMPEIERGAALDYLRIIKSKGSRFLSINQEGQAVGQTVVFQLVESSGGFARKFRFPYWMRTGYVEECYDVTE